MGMPLVKHMYDVAVLNAGLEEVRNLHRDNIGILILIKVA